MKWLLYIQVLINMFCITSNAQLSNNRNYIHTIIPRTEMGRSGETMETIQYFDGLGRLEQTNQYHASGNETLDIITSASYNHYGREENQYLPFASAQNGAYHTSSAVSSNFTSYNPSDQAYAFSQTVYEESPLNRVVKQVPPGAVWKNTSGHEVKMEYGTNTTGEVKYFYVDTSGALAKGTDYAAGELYRTTTWDENNLTTSSTRVIEYKDKLDRIILTVSFDELAYPTYYVYDDFGLLRFILPPKAADDGGITATELDQLCFQYIYDERNRMTKKKLPGADWVYMVYDKRDRLVLTQDGNLRTQNKWLYTKYDQLNRPVITGMYTHGSVATVENMRALIDAKPLYETRNTASYPSNHGYSNTMFPISGIDVQTVTYYDDYTFGDFNANASYDNSARYTTYHNSGYDNARASQNKGRLTGKKVKAGTSWLGSVFFYDKFSRNILTWKQNHLSGYDVVENQFLFTGQVEKSRHEHKTTYIPQALVLETSYYYDHAGRADYTTLQMSGYITKPLRRIADNDYNEIGQLISKKLNSTDGTSFTQQLDYTYNIRGWLTSINNPKGLGSDYFGLALCYDNISDINGLSDKMASFNGNISGTLWAGKYGTSSVRSGAYAYQYDGLNRITKADYGDLSGSTITDQANKYNVYNITYDKNGNIQSLTRDGATAVDDQLTYGYDPESNKLKYVNDAGNDANGFKELGGDNILEYTYDQAGNLKKDDNKQITNISYNHLNLPTSVTKNGTTISYLYDAEGNKLNFTMGTSDKDYDGQFIYEGNVLKQILFDEGRIIVNGTSASYEYFMKDHLGNTRVSFDESGTLVQTLAYYPFGMTMTSDGNQNNLYRYNGKELQEGTDWYDFQARYYDPQLARTTTMDPHAESYLSISPYSMFANNPLLFTDPNGEDINFYVWKYDEDDGWQRKQVQFNQLDATLQKALEGFAKTDAGYTFLKDFANKGDKLGSVEFSETGKYAKHDMDIAQFDTYGSAYGTSSFREGEDNIIFDMKINVNRNLEDENAESMAITTGHEAFIHIDQYKDKLINAYGKNDKTAVNQIDTQQRSGAADRNGGPDHDAYIRGNTKYSRMRTFVSQLRTILNPVQVDKQIKSHDDKYKRQLKH